MIGCKKAKKAVPQNGAPNDKVSLNLLIKYLIIWMEKYKEGITIASVPK